MGKGFKITLNFEEDLYEVARAAKISDFIFTVF